TPVWLFALMAPASIFFVLQGIVAVFVLIFSYASFVNQSRETASGRAPAPDELPRSKDQFLEFWDEFEREDDEMGAQAAATELVIVPAAPPATTPKSPKPSSKALAPAPTPMNVLWWLIFEQAKPVLWILTAICLLVGLILPANTQALWPLTTLLL